MSVQYISDEQGRHTAVIIPIDDWNALAAKYQELQTVGPPKRKPSDFVGSLPKETAQRMITDIEQARHEWERGI